MTIDTRIAADERDTVVVYDVMREAANRLVARLVAMDELSGGSTPHAEVMEQIAQLDAERRTIPTRDYDAIVAATAEFRRRRDALAA